MKIVATRLKAELEDDGSFYWFYVSIHLERTSADVPFENIALVEYHLLHKSIPNPDVRVTNAASAFEHKLWLYGFIAVSADIITKAGKLIKIPRTEITWDVTESETKLNGRSELSWS